jgi:hypothetical protein
MEFKKHINLLGLRCEDKITGLAGVVTSVCYDLYGCVQAVINPGLDKDGKPQETYWFDVARLEIIDDERVMDIPDFEYGAFAETKGPAEKPRVNKV